MRLRSENCRQIPPLLISDAKCLSPDWPVVIVAPQHREVARSDTTGKYSKKGCIPEGCQRAEMKRRRRTFWRENPRLATLSGI